MSGSEVSGVDLARVALRAAMEAARKNGGGQKAKSKPRVVRTVQRDGREPIGLGAALGALVTERAWTLPAAGASLCERWVAIAPDLARHIAAVGFDPESGQLTVCPDSSAWATKARLEQASSMLFTSSPTVSGFGTPTLPTMSSTTTFPSMTDSSITHATVGGCLRS
ncbi:DciA family protein [Streptomyces nojiriensis]|uniref:DciA family protein n=1 Tax=Streptomyces nojiriensis TaxID=66374 RepID=UPI0035DE531D